MSPNKFNKNACASPSCKHTCRVCGHKRCNCLRCGSLRLQQFCYTREYRDPSNKRPKPLARSKCCNCLQRPKPIHLIDLYEKEKLTFIEYANPKGRELNLSKKIRGRRSPPLSPENEARLKALILSILKPQNPLSTPPPSPNPQDPIDKNPKRNPDPDGSASAIFSTNDITAQTIYHLTTPPSARKPHHQPQSPQPPLFTTAALLRALTLTNQTSPTLLSTLLSTPYRPPLTRVSIRRN